MEEQLKNTHFVSTTQSAFLSVSTQYYLLRDGRSHRLRHEAREVGEIGPLDGQTMRPLATTTALVGGLSACYIASNLFRQRQRAQHGVVTTLYRYLRLRYHLRDLSKVIIIADFDRTLTTAMCKTSCHGVVESCAGLSASYRNLTTKLTEHYLPIEMDPAIPRAEKIPLMQEWYRRAHELLLQEPFTPALLESAVRESRIALRPGCDELLAGCHDRGVPVVVMSAGLGNVIKSVMGQRLTPGTAAKVVPSLPIVSNWLLFDVQDQVCGFSEPLLHMFNKDGCFIETQLAERWPQLSKGRHTILLLGDGLGDAHMADGFERSHTILKVGFLNEQEDARVAARLAQYEEAFDAVILADQPFGWLLNGLLRW